MRKVNWAVVRYHAARWIWVLALAILTHVAFPSSAADLAPLLDVGASATRQVVAPFDFVVSKTDDELRREQDELAASARPIYEFRQQVFDSVTTSARAFFEAVAESGATGHGVPFTAAEASYLGKSGKRRALERALDQLFDQALSQGVVAAAALRGESSPQVIVRHGQNETPVARDQIITFNAYLLRAQSLHPDPGSSTGDVVYLKLVRRFFRPTLVRNDQETIRRRTELMSSVERSKYAVRQGDVIVEPNEIVSGAGQEKLAALHAELVRRGAATSRAVGGVVGPVLRDLMILSVFWVLMFFYRRETYRQVRQVATVSALFAATILGAAAVARALPGRPELIPLPFTAMMVTVLFNGRVSMIGAMILSALIATQPVLHDTPALFMCLVGGVTAALSVKTLGRRSHLYTAVLLVGIGYLLGELALGLAGDWPVREIGWRTILGTANGLVSASLTILLLPMAERATQITTDLTLLELSDPSRPLLRRLSLEAPGTYAHSIAMANLVEAACNKIGGNGLLGRVGCYYHDVGKLINPQFFVENQSRGGNPHDRLAADKSAEIIKQHVTEGLRLARAAGIPDVVASFIPEHHGTAEITYFLDRAKKQGGSARSEDFRYPGPRPRSIETGVTMLADSVEAALRVFEDLTPAKLEAAIDQLIKTKLATGQLDDAPLTLRQLDQVKAEFVRVLTGMYHNRIDYPEASGGITKAWQPAQPTAEV
jgi:putative nucleotidyltransferase with HDIG domain